MGSSLSYIAVKGKPTEQILEELCLKRINYVLPRPYVIDRLTGGGQLPGGWYFIIKDHSDLSSLIETAKSLSREGIVMLGQVEEHVNFASASCWMNGTEVWSVTHNLSKGGLHLEVLGTPPENFHAIQKRIDEERAAISPADRWDHYFSIPVELFYEIVGYRYDILCHQLILEVLAPEEEVDAVHRTITRLEKHKQKSMEGQAPPDEFYANASTPFSEKLQRADEETIGQSNWISNSIPRNNFYLDSTTVQDRIAFVEAYFEWLPQQLLRIGPEMLRQRREVFVPFSKREEFATDYWSLLHSKFRTLDQDKKDQWIVDSLMDAQEIYCFVMSKSVANAAQAMRRQTDKEHDIIAKKLD